jgi:hypothetical protein
MIDGAEESWKRLLAARYSIMEGPAADIGAPACAAVLWILWTFCPRARPFSGF